MKISEVKDALSQMDTVSNVLGALIMNGLFQYHVHILAGLHSWKKQHADNIENWLDVIAEFEALNSLANYYNYLCKVTSYKCTLSRPSYRPSFIGYY